MDGEVTAEQARELLDALVEGGGMKHIDTPLALRLIRWPMTWAGMTSRPN